MTYFIKFGDQSDVDTRRGGYGTDNPSFYLCSIAVRNRTWNGNPSFGKYLERSIIQDFQARNGGIGPQFVQAPAGTEWYYIWNQQVHLQQVVADLEAAKGPGNNAAGVNARLIQIVQGWGNNPPQ